MRKWNLKKRIALLLAVMMFIMNCIPAYAEEVSYGNEYNNAGDIQTVDQGEGIASDNNGGDTAIVSDNENSSVVDVEEGQNGSRVPVLRSGGAPARLRANPSGTPSFDLFTEAGTYWWCLSGNKLWISGNKAGNNNISVVKEAVSDGGEDPERVYYIDFVEENGSGDSMSYTLQNGAFNDFTNLKTFEVKKCVEVIQHGVFVGCTNLKSFSVEAGHSKYAVNPDPSDENGVLYTTDCETLVAVPTGASKSLIISSNTMRIEQAAAQYTLIPGIVKIPASVQTIGSVAFADCPLLREVIFEGRDETDASKISSCKTIGDEAFARGDVLRKVEIPESFADPGGCNFLNDVFVGNTVLNLYIYGKKNYKSEGKTKDEESNRLSIEQCPDFSGDGVSMVIGVPLETKVALLDKDSGYWADGTQDVIRIWLMEKDGTGKYSLGADVYKVNSSDPNQKYIYWYDSDKSSKYYASTPVTTDLRLKPVFDTAYTVSFNRRSETDYDVIIPESFNVTGLSTLEQIKTDITKPNNIITPKKERKFLGWKREKNGRVYTYYLEDDDDWEKFLKFVVKDNEVFEAFYSDIYNVNLWLDKDRKVKLLSANVPEGKMITDGVITVNGTEKEIDSYDKIKDDPWISAEIEKKYDSAHYKFKGWYEDGKKLPWASSDRVYSDVNLYYGYNRYVIVSYNYGPEYEAKYPNTTVSESVLFDKAIKGHKLPMYQNLPGWYFDCWKNRKTGAVCVGSAIVQEDTIFDAVWKKVHTISLNKRIDKDSYNYNKMEGDEIEVIDGQEIGPDLDKVKPEDLGTDEEALAFLEWNTKPEPKKKGDTVTRSYVVNGDMQLYARYTEGHGVRFMSDGEEAGWAVIKHGRPLENKNFPSINKLGFYDIRTEDGSDADFEKKSEWNTKPDGSGVRITTSTVVDKAIVAYAVWKDDPNEKDDPQVMLSFNTMGGPEIDPVEVSVNYAVPKPADPTWADHKFQGWFTSPDYEKEWNFDDPVTENMYLYAKWITWTEEDEDRSHGIYWVRILRKGKASLSQYFQESGLKYSYDRKIVKLNKGSRTIEGKKTGETMITATKVDGSEYPVSVRVFVLKQQLRDMYAYTAGTQFDANEALTVSGFPPDRWESTKPDVASIDAKTGIITVRKRGKSRIKAYYKNRAVTATFRSEVPKFAKSFYRLKTGQKKKLKIKRLKKYDIVSWNVLPDGALSVANPSWNDIEKAAEEAYSTSRNSTSGNRSVSFNYVSSNEIMGIGSAEIDANGRITALTAGDVIVYAAVYGQIISTRVHIEPPILRTKSMILKINKTARLKLSRTKLKNVEWKSSNDQVAYVDPTTGKVYGLKSGRVTLRTHAGGVVNSCAVQVQDTTQITKGPALSR